MSEEIKYFLLIFSLVLVINEKKCSTKYRIEDCKQTDLNKIHELKAVGGLALIYGNFSNFEMLDVNCDLAFYYVRMRNYNTSMPLEYLGFRPNRRTLIAKPLNLSLSSDLFDLSENYQFEIEISNLFGFNFEINPLIVLNNVYEFASLIIEFTKLDLYTNGKLVDEEMCEKLLDEEDFFSSQSRNRTNGAFANMHLISITFFKDIDYTRKVCPLIFHNALLHKVLFYDFKSDFFSRNYFQVMKLKSNKSVEMLKRHLNSRIEKLSMLNVNRVRISKYTLDEFVFDYTLEITLKGTLDSIETDVFKPFKHLQHLRFTLYNTREFYHLTENKWMAYLNYNKPNREKKEENLLFLYVQDISFSYLYPDEDFCLFKYFPHDSNVLIILNQELPEYLHLKDRPTCTIFYLYKNYPSFKYLPDFSLFYDYFDLRKSNECNFTQMMSACNSTAQFASYTRSLSNLNYYDLTYFFEWFEFIGPIITFPIVCILGFVLNLFIIIILTRKENEIDFQEKMYKYMLINSAFNCVECFVTIFNLLSLCISVNSIYCPELRKSYFSQYFRIYIVGYFGEIMKTCSILTSIGFSLERYVQTSKTKVKLFVFISRSSITKITLVIVAFGALSSVSKIYEFNFGSVYKPSMESDYPNRFMITYKKPFNLVHFLYFFHYIFNDLVLWLVNAVIDYCLIIIVKSNLRKKEKISQRMGVNSQSAKKKSQLNDEIRNQTNKIIIASLVVYSFCRLPELVAYLFFYFMFYTDGTASCYDFYLCYFLANVIEYFYMLSYSANIYLYYQFNKNFRKNFVKLFKFNSSYKRLS